MDVVDCLFAILFLIVVVLYELQADRLVSERNRWREKCWRYELFEVPTMRSALSARQDQVEGMQDEIDRLRVERVVPESVGNGGRC